MTPQPDTTPSVRIATPGDYAFVDDLQKRWRRNIGFLRRSALQGYIQRGYITLIDSNGWEAAYVIHAPQPNGICRVAQIAVHPDLLRTALGSQLMAAVDSFARDRGQTTIRLRSREDLPANLFWPTLGYACTAQTAPLGKRHLTRYEWSKPLSPIQLPLPIAEPTAPPPPPAPRIGLPTIKEIRLILNARRTNQTGITEAPSGRT